MRKINFYIAIFLAMMQISVYSQIGGEPPVSTIDYNNINMPESPTSASLGKIDALTVNTATGIPNISIPIYTFEIDGVSVPISIVYNASGIKVTDLATSVGLNWTLQAGGQISRTVRGKADDFEGWFDPNYTFLSDAWFNSYDPNNPFMWQRQMSGHQPGNVPSKAQEHDHNPDLFSYSFLGYSGNFIHKPNTDIIKDKTDGLEIIDWTHIKDQNGNEFQFLGTFERSNNKNYYSTDGDLNIEFFDWEEANGNIPITAWKLEKIITKNGKQIVFEYQDTGNFTYTINNAGNNITVGYGCPYDNPVIKSLTKTTIEYNFNTQLINRISSPDGNIEVTFTYLTDSNLPEGVWGTQLDEITIIDHTDVQNPKKRGYRFTYSRYDGDPRLRLDQLYEVWYINNTQTVEKPSYKFLYKPGSLPSKNSLAQDFFGYFNNATSNSSLVPSITGLPQTFQGYFNQNSGNRSLNPNFVDVGILKEIHYPIGGKTILTYEPNSIFDSNSGMDKYLGGLRIQKIQEIDKNEIVSQRIYQYEDLHGISMEQNRNHTIKQQGDFGTNSYYSSFTSIPGNILDEYRSGYFYGKVTIITSDPDSSNNLSYKEEHFFEQNLISYHKFDYALKEKRYYKDGASLPIKIEEYTNELIGSPTYFTWNILGDMMCFEISNDWSLGHNNIPIKVDYAGNYAFLPTRLAITEFFGVNREPVTMIKDFLYDPNTLLKKQETIDTRYTRVGPFNYDNTNNNGEIIKTFYEYPWSNGINLPNLPAALPISKKVTNNNKKILGQYFVYDSNGNIKTTYQYNKGQGSNNSNSNYIPANYEEMTSFIFQNGKPSQVKNKDGIPISYIYGYNNQYPVAKIENKKINTIPQSLINAIHTASGNTGSETQMIIALNALRNDPSMANAMATTFIHRPLVGVTSITDPKGDKITFYYDAFGRLDYIKDKDGNRLSENEYNYRENN